MFRTDPLTEDGKIDLDFFDCCDFEREQKNLIKYLLDEGFDQIKSEIFIDFRGKKWQVFRENKK
jgi:hypothetical protein